MTTKHTPGPWRIERQDIFGDELNGYICTWSGKTANANLIAASPDLLESCNSVIAGLKEFKVSRRGPTIESMIDLLAEAIAKAEGV